MMASLQFKFLLTCLCLLIPHSTKGVDGQCSPPPLNLAVYEGTQNTLLTCDSPTKVSYSIKPASDPISTYTITNYDDTVATSLRNLYGVNQTDLIIKIDQGNAATPPISTAGMYAINPNGTNRVGAKLVVVRQPPTCGCKAINSTKVNIITCSLTYADVGYSIISAIMKWTINGNPYQTDTPGRTASTSYYVSTSTITVNASDPDTYTCTVTFSKPAPQFTYVATNAPEFSASCTSPSCPNTTTTMPTTFTSTKEPITTVTNSTPSTEGTTPAEETDTSPPNTGVDGQCAPINLAVYEGTQNTILTCDSPTKVSYTIKPYSDPLTTYTITNYDDTVATSLKNLYAVNQSGLIIKIDQGNAATPPISTAGLYIINPNGTNRVGAKLVVVRQPPTCGCKAINATRFNLTCILTYADSTYMPISAIMKWTINGNTYQTDNPTRTLNTGSPYYTSTSTITVTANNPLTYTCTIAFTKPAPQLAYVATNAPTINASCSISTCANITTTTIPTTLTSTTELTTTVTTTTPSTEKTTTEETTPASVTDTPPPNTDCVCTPSTACPTPDQLCTKASECQAVGTNATDVYGECVVKAELYARCDNCCTDDLICGVVVTLRNDNRWLIYDPQCDDNKCEMVVVSASCMSSEWKLLAERKITRSGVGDYIQTGYSVHFGANVTDCSDSCKRMMNLP